MHRLALALLLALACTQQTVPAQANILDTIGNAFSDAWGAVSGAATSAFTFVECKAVDVATFDFDQCKLAQNTSDPCTSACKAQLDKLPGACLDRLVGQVAASGNGDALTYFEEQLDACNLTYTVPNSAPARLGYVVVPLVVLAASMVLLELLAGQA